MIAIPSEPPTCRMLLMTAEPTPALSTGTDAIAAAVVGAITVAIPTPPTSRAGRMFQNDEDGEREDGDCEQRQHARRSPRVIVRLDQSVREREQPDAGAQKTRKIESPLP